MHFLCFLAFFEQKQVNLSSYNTKSRKNYSIPKLYKITIYLPTITREDKIIFVNFL